MKYLKKFETDSARVEYEGGGEYIEPYVSYVEGDNSVHYNKVETKLAVYYDIQDISSPTTICTNYDSSIKSIEVDGVLLDSVVKTYQFDSVGEHVIKYEFNNPTTVGNSAPLFYNITTIKRVVIPDTFTAIGMNTFNSCSGLTNVTIGSGVTSISEVAFENCSSLTSVTIPDSVISIGRYAFGYCNNLISVTIGNGVTSIGNGVFRKCSNLTSVTIPSSVTNIGGSLGDFNYEDIIFETINPNATFVCDNTNKVLVSIDNSTLICGFSNTVAIPNSVTSIGNTAFDYCASLTNITIPDSVTSIGNDAFNSCTSLTSVTIGNSVTSIGQAAFYGCEGLTSVAIPNSVTSIGDSVFMSCTSLTSITSFATTAPTIQRWTFYKVKTGGTLTVPSGSSGYDVWMGTGNYYLGLYNWTKVEQ